MSAGEQNNISKDYSSDEFDEVEEEDFDSEGNTSESEERDFKELEVPPSTRDLEQRVAEKPEVASTLSNDDSRTKVDYLQRAVEGLQSPSGSSESYADDSQVNNLERAVKEPLGDTEAFADDHQEVVNNKCEVLELKEQDEDLCKSLHSRNPDLPDQERQPERVDGLAPADELRRSLGYEGQVEFDSYDARFELKDQESYKSLLSDRDSRKNNSDSERRLDGVHGLENELPESLKQEALSDSLGKELSERQVPADEEREEFNADSHEFSERSKPSHNQVVANESGRDMADDTLRDSSRSLRSGSSRYSSPSNSEGRSSASDRSNARRSKSRSRSSSRSSASRADDASYDEPSPEKEEKEARDIGLDTIEPSSEDLATHDVVERRVQPGEIDPSVRDAEFDVVNGIEPGDDQVEFGKPEGFWTQETETAETVQQLENDTPKLPISDDLEIGDDPEQVDSETVPQLENGTPKIHIFNVDGSESMSTIGIPMQPEVFEQPEESSKTQGFVAEMDQATEMIATEREEGSTEKQEMVEEVQVSKLQSIRFSPESSAETENLGAGDMYESENITGTVIPEDGFSLREMAPDDPDYLPFLPSDAMRSSVSNGSESSLHARFQPPDKPSPNWKKGRGPAAQACNSFMMRNRDRVGSSPKYHTESDMSDTKSGGRMSKSADLFSVFRTGDQAKLASKRATRAVVNELEDDWENFPGAFSHSFSEPPGFPFDGDHDEEWEMWNSHEGPDDDDEEESKALVSESTANGALQVVVTPVAEKDVALDPAIDGQDEEKVKEEEKSVVPGEEGTSSATEENVIQESKYAEYLSDEAHTMQTSMKLSKLQDFLLGGKAAPEHSMERTASKSSTDGRSVSKLSADERIESKQSSKPDSELDRLTSNQAPRKSIDQFTKALFFEVHEDLPPPGQWRFSLTSAHAITTTGSEPEAESPNQAKLAVLHDHPLATWEDIGHYCNAKAWDGRRHLYEGGQEIPRLKLLELIGNRRSLTETDKFLNLLKEKGDGSVGIAWRRYFDTDGDGALSFIEFCDALTAVNYRGDVLQLWRDFGGDSSNELGLEVLDAESAQILEFFTKWCVENFGGPMEMFQALDDDGSDSLEKAEFAEGIREQNFFNLPDIPECLDSEEKVQKKLYPLLDSHYTGVIQPDQLLFLEKDEKKKKRWTKILAKKREGCVIQDVDTEPNQAESLLKDVAWDTTRCGKTHWGMLGPTKFLDPPPLSRESRGSVSLPNLDSHPRRGRKPVPKFLREFREAKQKENIFGKGQSDRLGSASDRVSTAASTSDLPSLPVGGLGISPVVVASASLGTIPQQRKQGDNEVGAMVDAKKELVAAQAELQVIEKKLTAKQAEALTVQDKDRRSAIQLEVQTLERQKSGIARRMKGAQVRARKAELDAAGEVLRVSEHGHQSPPGSKPSPQKKGWSPPRRRKLPIAWASSHADATKIVSQRKAYGGSFVTNLPKANLKRCPQVFACEGGDTSGNEIDVADRDCYAWSRSEDKTVFRPHMTFDFFTANKALGLFKHYDIGHS